MCVSSGKEFVVASLALQTECCVGGDQCGRDVSGIGEMIKYDP